MKPELKPPEIKRLKLKYDELLSTLAFNFNLRRYTKGFSDTVMFAVKAAAVSNITAGGSLRTSTPPSLKVSSSSARLCQYDHSP